jgi:hypothetical protein
VCGRGKTDGYGKTACASFLVGMLVIAELGGTPGVVSYAHTDPKPLALAAAGPSMHSCNLEEMTRPRWRSLFFIQTGSLSEHPGVEH